MRIRVSAKRTHKQEKLARVYDDEILPIWTQRFGRMIVQAVEPPAKAMILDVSCGTGYSALEILRKMDDQSRLIAIDSSSALLDVARKKAGDLSGKRIYFRTENVGTRLPFTADVYDIVACNLGLSEVDDPATTLRDFVRVAKPGGKVVCTLPLAGTWGEFFDIYREVLVKHDKHPILEKLDEYIAEIPDASTVEEWGRAAGLADARVDIDEFTLLFRSAREFFFAPIVELGPLPRWKDIAGKGQDLQDVFWHIKQAIDAYFGDRAFQVTVKAGCLTGTKGNAPADEDDLRRPPLTDEEVLDLATGEVELMEELPPDPDADEEDTDDPGESSDTDLRDTGDRPVPLLDDDEELEAFKDED
jgi:ubiquinone/menaquinone biosynthesis C-methylase UbiE